MNVSALNVCVVTSPVPEATRGGSWAMLGGLRGGALCHGLFQKCCWFSEC